MAPKSGLGMFAAAAAAPVGEMGIRAGTGSTGSMEATPSTAAAPLRGRSPPRSKRSGKPCLLTLTSLKDRGEIDSDEIFGPLLRKRQRTKACDAAPAPKQRKLRGQAPLRPTLDGGTASTTAQKPSPQQNAGKSSSSSSSSQQTRNTASHAARPWAGVNDTNRERERADHVAQMRENLNANVREALDMFFKNKTIYENDGNAKMQQQAQNIAADFAVSLAGTGLRACFDRAIGCDHVFLRLEMDATSREVRGTDRRVDRSAKWLASALSAWFVGPKIEEDQWPRWSYIPTNTTTLLPGRDLPEDLKPSERNARLGLELLWEIIKELPRNVKLSVIVAGDAAETACILSLLGLLESKIRALRPDILYLPWAHRCSVHQATLVGEEGAGLMCSLAGTTTAKFQNKIYLQVLQKKRQNRRYAELVEGQTERLIEVMTPEEAQQLSQDVEDFRQFLVDLDLPKQTRADFRGCVPQVQSYIDSEGEVQELFVLKVPSEMAKKKVTKRWVRLYRNLREPKFNRWLTFGHSARLESLHEALNSIENLGLKKPWFMTTEDWKEFTEDPHLHDRYNCLKLLVGHIFRPLDILTAFLLSDKGGVASTTKLKDKAAAAFRNEALVLIDRRRIQKQMDFVTMFSSQIATDEKQNLQTDAYISLQAAAASFAWRITSGARDLHDVLRIRFLEAKELDEQSTEPGHKNKRQAAVVEEVMKKADDKLLGEPGAVVLMSIAKTLKPKSTPERIALLTSLFAGLQLSASHQAACERLIALAKAEQQAMFSAMKGILRISGGVVRRKLVNGWNHAVRYAEQGSDTDGDSENSEVDYDSDDEAARRRYADLVEDRRLMKMKVDPSWYSEYLRDTKTSMVNKKDQGKVDEETKLRYKSIARKKKNRRNELLLARDAERKRAEQLATSKRFARARRARIQMEFYLQLQRMIYERFSSYGKGKEWGWSSHLASMRLRLSSQQIAPWTYDQGPIDLYKYQPTGLERLLGWTIACTLGKKTYSKLEEWFCTEEREDEYDELQELFEGENNFKAVFDAGTRTVIAVKLPPCPREALSALIPEALVILLIERSPFSFVAAPAKMVEAGQEQHLVMTDIILDSSPFVSASSRPALRTLNGRTGGQLMAVEFISAARGEIKAAVRWSMPIKIPSQQKAKKREPILAATNKKSTPGSAAAAADGGKGTTGNAPPKPVNGIVRMHTLQFEDPDEQKKQRAEKARGNKQGEKEGRKQGGAKGFPKEGKQNGAKTKRKVVDAGGDPISDDCWEEVESDDGVQLQSELIKYNMNSEEERKNFIRRTRMELEAGGGCPVDGFEMEILGVARLAVRPTGDDGQYLLEALSKKLEDFSEWFAFRGKHSTRYFHFHPRKQGWRWAFRLASLWARRTSVLFDLFFGTLADDMKFENVPCDSVRDVQNYCLSCIEKEAEAVRPMELSGRQREAATRMQTFPTDCIAALQKLGKKNDFKFPSATRAAGAQTYEAFFGN